MAKPTVAILGRPNVGKSTLFNRLTRTRRAIVDEKAGVTRDRIYGNVEWAGKEFHLIDTGGYLEGVVDDFNVDVRKQAIVASDEAHLIVFMVDSHSGVMADDHVIANRMRRDKKTVVLVVNKIDDMSHEDRALEFYELGLGDPMGIGASSGRSVGDLLDRITDELKLELVDPDAEDDSLGLAIVGVPNAGKSSFVNTLIQEEKSIVTPIPGTTRDSVDSHMNFMNRKLRLIDTAGLRRKAKVDDDLEYYSTVRTMRSIDECQVAVVMVDAERGFNMQDRQIMAMVLEKGKGLVAVINKWDIMEKDSSTMGTMVKQMRDDYKPLANIPILFISVHHNQRLRKVLETAIRIDDERSRKISTSKLNEFLDATIRYLPPPAVQAKRIRIKYVTQVHSSPPVFAFFCNHPKLIPVSYKRYLENRMRDAFGFEGVPLKISFRQK